MTEIDTMQDVKAGRDDIVEKEGGMRQAEMDSSKVVLGNMTANQVADAYRAALTEHNMKFWDACKIYKKALWWTMIMGMVGDSLGSSASGLIVPNFQAIIMESYDTILVGSFYALPAFQKRFGHQLHNGTYQLSASWQSGLCPSDQCLKVTLLTGNPPLAIASNIGLIIGIFANGVLVDRWGRESLSVHFVCDTLTETRSKMRLRSPGLRHCVHLHPVLCEISWYATGW